jgi:hypothetical protein
MKKELLKVFLALLIFACISVWAVLYDTKQKDLLHYCQSSNGQLWTEINRLQNENDSLKKELKYCNFRLNKVGK